MAATGIVHLEDRFFGERERTLLEYGGLTASAFRYDSGVCAVRIRNDFGEIVMLPFQGQQVWSAEFMGRNLTMKSMFGDPQPTRDYVANYGGFLIHCGITAMGSPGVGDTHPLHGELPNAPFQRAWLEFGQDEDGAYIGLGGQYQHTIAFSHSYIAQPSVRLHEASTLIHVSLDVTNVANAEMPLMYLAHVNFRPVDGGRLVTSAIPSAAHERVRTVIPAHIQPKAGYREFIAELAEHPEKHHVFTPGLVFDPEVVFYIDCLTDENGWSHSLQIHPDGGADYIRHRPQELRKGVRWICRTADQQALGLMLPATAEPEGYHAELAKGNVRTLKAGKTFSCHYDAGMVGPKDAARMEKQIGQIVKQARK